MRLVAAPPDFGEAIGEMPDGVKPVTRGTLDFAMLFVRAAWSGLKFVRRLWDR